MPELAISTTFIGYEDVLPYLPLINQYGITNLELRGYPPRLDYHDQDYLEKLKTELKRQKITVSSYHLPFHDCYLSSLDETEREAAVATVFASIEAAAFLEAECLVAHPGGLCRNKKERGQREAHSLKSIQEIYRVTRSLGMPLAIENMFAMRIGQGVDWLIEVTETIGGDLFGVCLDTSHVNCSGGDLAEWLEKLGGKIINVHFSDNRGKKDEHLFPFLGKIDWDTVLGLLKQTGYNRPWTLEVHQCDVIESMLTEAVICHSRLSEIWERK